MYEVINMFTQNFAQIFFSIISLVSIYTEAYTYNLPFIINDEKLAWGIDNFSGFEKLLEI